MTLHKEFWGFLFLGFVALIFVSSDPKLRIERTCKPVVWVGNVVTSLTSLVMPQHQTRVDEWFGNLDYSCQYMTWRLFYQDDYNKWLESQKQTASAPVGVAPRPASAPVASAPASAVPVVPAPTKVAN